NFRTETDAGHESGCQPLGCCLEQWRAAGLRQSDLRGLSGTPENRQATPGPPWITDTRIRLSGERGVRSIGSRAGYPLPDPAELFGALRADHPAHHRRIRAEPALRQAWGKRYKSDIGRRCAWRPRARYRNAGAG